MASQDRDRARAPAQAPPIGSPPNGRAHRRLRRDRLHRRSRPPARWSIAARARCSRRATRRASARWPRSSAAWSGRSPTSTRPDTVRALVERGDVLVSTVGPFARWGEPAVQAAIAAGAHYLDSTGEGSFIRDVFERFGPGAQAAGCGLLTAFGYDWVPGNLAGALALRDAGRGARRACRSATSTRAPAPASMSGGTRASSAGVMLSPGFAWHGGRIVDERAARHGRAFEICPGKRARAISVGSLRALRAAARRTRRCATSTSTWAGSARPRSRCAALSAGMSARDARSPARATRWTALVRAPGQGLDRRPRRRGPRHAARRVVLAEAYDAAGTRLADVRLEGVNGYDFTAALPRLGRRDRRARRPAGHRRAGPGGRLRARRAAGGLRGGGDRARGSVGLPRGALRRGAAPTAASRQGSERRSRRSWRPGALPLARATRARALWASVELSEPEAQRSRHSSAPRGAPRRPRAGAPRSLPSSMRR